jgi:hypothetical protein
MIDRANTVGTPPLALRRAAADAPTGLDRPAPPPRRPTARRLGENGAVALASGVTSDPLGEAA